MSFKQRSKKIGKVIFGILVAAIVVASIFALLNNKQQTVDTAYLVSTLEKSSELTSAKLTYTGMSKFEDSGIPFINKSSFNMIYKATARTGIDVKEIKIDTDNLKHIVYITIPKAKVLDVKVDLNSIRFFDTKFSVLNFNGKENGIKAVFLAEEEAKKEAANMGILEMADVQSELLIKGLIQEVIPKSYIIKIRR